MESENPRVHQNRYLITYILGCFRTVHTSTPCSLRSINKPHIHPSAPGTQTSLLVCTSSDSVFMCTFTSPCACCTKRLSYSSGMKTLWQYPVHTTNY